jgi:hypothetical protein
MAKIFRSPYYKNIFNIDFNDCSYQKKVKDGAFSFGLSSAIVGLSVWRAYLLARSSSHYSNFVIL